MLSLRAWALTWGLCASALALSREASGRPADAGTHDSGGPTVTPGAVMAYYCGEAELQCFTAPLSWEHTFRLPIAFDWDTGWIPESFPQMQARFHVSVPAETVVKMAARLTGQWPRPMTLAVPGERYSGMMKFNYGLLVEALGKIDVSVAGQQVFWQGELPYVPQIDFRMMGGSAFDPFALPPDSVSASGLTESVQLFEIGFADLLGLPLSVVDIGLNLKVEGELKATYSTQKINIVAAKPDDQPEIAPLTVAMATTEHSYVGGPYVEYDVNPDGQVHYDGIVHLKPYAFAEIKGLQKLEVPFADIPITVPLGDVQFLFDRIRVHVPLPDLESLEGKEVNFGKVEVGSSKRQSFELKNGGEARARAVAQVDPEIASIFRILNNTETIEPNESKNIEIRFSPKEPGPFWAILTVASNDPDTPKQTVKLKAQAVDPTDPEPSTGGDDGTSDPGEEEPEDSNLEGNGGSANGCGCHGVGGHGPADAWWMALGMLAIGVGSRRRRPIPN